MNSDDEKWNIFNLPASLKNEKSAHIVINDLNEGSFSQF